MKQLISNSWAGYSGECCQPLWINKSASICTIYLELPLVICSVCMSGYFLGFAEFFFSEVRPYIKQILKS